MACSTAAASATVRVIGPVTSAERNNGTTPARLVRPIVGRMPTRLKNADGPRIELPVSVPRPTAPRLSETAAAVPPEEPAVTRERSYGLRVYPGRMELTVS